MAHFSDDIPEARRETLVVSPEPSLANSSSNITLWILLAMTVLGLGSAGIWWLKLSPPLARATKSGQSSEEPTAESPPATGSAVAAETPVASPPPAADATAAPDSGSENSLLGHRPYEVADSSSLVTISTNPMVRLKPEVAQKVETMLVQARSAGVSLDVISGFRSLEDQQYLFFDLKAERGQTTQTRAEVSAPPGYSEHHTGYAVDFVDLAQPATELNAAFETTPAFRWLKENAAYYGFEMSFPKDNDQNVTYEPWHWRYVGNQESLELFYQD